MEPFARIIRGHLEKWVATQKNVLDAIKSVEPQLEKADRLELVLATRMAFKHMVRTIEAFDKWLQDPFIIGHMPREMLEDVRRRVWKILEELLLLDIEHTSQFKEHIEKLALEGKLNPLLYSKREDREEPRIFV